MPLGGRGRRRRYFPWPGPGAGDKAVQTAQGTCMLYVHAGTNPFDTITQAVKCVIVTC